jgi:thiamine kinase-like enzyme
MCTRGRGTGAPGELDDVLERLQDELGPLAGDPVELAGGITNRNVRVALGDGEYVVRRPGKDTQLLGIDRAAELAASEAAAALGIAPAVAAFVDGCLVTEFIAGRSLRPRELADAAAEVAGALRAFHDSAISLPARFSVPSLLDDYAAIVLGSGGLLPGDYEAARAAAAAIAAALAPRASRPCHNDLLAGNLIRESASRRLMLVDWEYAGLGDARFDLGNVSVNNDFDEADEERLLASYDGQTPCDARRAELKLMQVMSDAREGAWGVVQGAISELEFDFAAYAQRHFERLRETAESAEFDEWLAAVTR